MEDKKFSYLLWFRRQKELIELQQKLDNGSVKLSSRDAPTIIFCHFVIFYN